MNVTQAPQTTLVPTPNKPWKEFNSLERNEAISTFFQTLTPGSVFWTRRTDQRPPRYGKIYTAYTVSRLTPTEVHTTEGKKFWRVGSWAGWEKADIDITQRDLTMPPIELEEAKTLARESVLQWLAHTNQHLEGLDLPTLIATSAGICQALYGIEPGYVCES